MPFLADRVLDLGLNVLDVEATHLHICSAEPVTYAQASGALSLGNKAALNIGAPAPAVPKGRRVTVAAITDGVVTATGDVTHLAIVDAANSRLLATATITDSQRVTVGNPFTLAPFDVVLPGV